MRDFNEILEQVERNSAICTRPLYRGQNDARLQLRPSLGRFARTPHTEHNLFRRFKELGAYMFEGGTSSWDVLFQMRHHGLPTRLLDWTESFAVALYFGLHGATRQASVWVLNSDWLNQEEAEYDGLIYPESKWPDGYERFFLDESASEYGDFSHKAVAIAGTSFSSRMRSQRAVFTLHGELKRPLDAARGPGSGALTKLRISKSMFSDAEKFLTLAGVNSFSLFPDLDGLSRYLKRELTDHLPTGADLRGTVLGYAE